MINFSPYLHLTCQMAISAGITDGYILNKPRHSPSRSGNGEALQRALHIYIITYFKNPEG